MESLEIEKIAINIELPVVDFKNSARDQNKEIESVFDGE